MFTIYDLKPAFQNLLRPITIFLANHGVSANVVTVFTCLVSIFLGLYISLYPNQPIIYLLLPIFLFFRMALNAIDGMLAREHNMKTHLGAFLNEITDVLSDGFLYFPFALNLGVSPEITTSFILLSSTTEITGVVAAQVNGVRRYDGPFGKSDRAFAIGLLSLLTYFKIAPFDFVSSNFIFIIFCFLSLVTIYKRIQSSLRKG